MTLETIKNIIEEHFPNSIEAFEEVFGKPTFTVKASDIVKICRFLKENPDLYFDYLMSLTAVEWPDRFDVVYHLYSIEKKHFLTLKIKTDKENCEVPSVTSVWNAANWQEREVFDMFGIRFDGHPNLKRILLEPTWEGFPLRKDYVEQ